LTLNPFRFIIHYGTIGHYMDNSNNVISFPKPYVGPKTNIDAEEITRNVEMMKHYHIQETISNIAPMIFNQLDIAGFDLADEEALDIKDGAFIIEALRSMMCKHYGMYHPFQQISENVFFPDKEEVGALKIVDSINIKLKKSETI
jgi:hypothetical protein